MSPARGPAALELDAEEEIDLRSAWARIANRWWLPVGGLLVGAVVGLLLSVGGGDVYRAETILYLGQPFTPNGGGQIQSLATNPKTVSEIVRSDSAIKRASLASGLRPGQLRGKISSQAIASPGAARNLSPLVEVSVTAPAAAKAEKAAGSLASSVIDSVSEYVDRKITLLEEQITSDEQGLEAANERIAAALQQQREAVGNKQLSLAERILIQANANSTLNFYEARITNLRADRNNAEQLLSLAQNVERSRVVQSGEAVRTTATSRRNAALIGALAGLVLGALAAYLADPFLARGRAAAPH